MELQWLWRRQEYQEKVGQEKCVENEMYNLEPVLVIFLSFFLIFNDFRSDTSVFIVVVSIASKENSS
jgi:hypothetical protein